MRLPPPRLVRLVAIAGTIAAAVAVARAETWTLELKRLDSPGPFQTLFRPDGLHLPGDLPAALLHPNDAGWERRRPVSGQRTAGGRVQEDREEGAQVPVAASLPRRGQAGRRRNTPSRSMLGSEARSEGREVEKRESQDATQAGFGHRQAEREAHQGDGSAQGGRLRPALLRLQSQRRPDRR